MLVLVCGSRGWTDAETIRVALAVLPADVTILHGDAHGADRMAGRVAAELGHTVRVMPAEWNRYGNRAGYVRNIAMLDERPDLVIAFHDGQSRGTQHTIREARRRRIRVEVWHPVHP